jgi:hypothetical protein
MARGTTLIDLAQRTERHDKVRSAGTGGRSRADAVYPLTEVTRRSLLGTTIPFGPRLGGDFRRRQSLPGSHRPRLATDVIGFMGGRRLLVPVNASIVLLRA